MLGDEDSTDSDTDYHRYMNELMLDLHALQQTGDREHHFTHVNKLLINEIERVWTSFYCNNQQNNSVNIPYRQEAGKNNDTSFLNNVQGGDQIEMKEKVFIPKTPENSKCNLIGRIIGPCGMSIKQLEAETNCSIRIRGEGSVKDPRKEKYLKHVNGWEHLYEPLHVLIIARDNSKAVCEWKLRMAVNVVRTLLSPTHDEYKKKQLIQLAIINGTYRHRNNILAMSSSSSS